MPPPIIPSWAGWKSSQKLLAASAERPTSSWIASIEPSSEYGVVKYRPSSRGWLKVAMRSANSLRRRAVKILPRIQNASICNGNNFIFSGIKVQYLSTSFCFLRILEIPSPGSPHILSCLPDVSLGGEALGGSLHGVLLGSH
jgi:hypothetical protein